MSYDLAVWEGERPADDQLASATYTDLYDRCIEQGADLPATERIAAYVGALVDR